MPIVDFHVHLFPDALAGRTLPKLSHTAADAHGDAPYFTDGTLSGTLASLQRWGVTAAVTQHIATSVHSMHKVNDFAASVRGPQLYAFGSVHPDAPDALEELERIKSLGLDGVKLHPDYQCFFVDEPRMAPLYEKMAQLQLPVLFHSGWDPLSPDLVHAEPERLQAVVEGYPGLTVIAAHLGGMQRYDQVERYLLGHQNLYIDTAMTSPYLHDPARCGMPEHEGHRKRLRERAAQTGLEGFQPHEVLELLLSETIPRKDVNPLAHALIDRFGSFSGVLNAAREELLQVPGVIATAAGAAVPA